MANQKRGTWWKLSTDRPDYLRPEVIEHEAEMRLRKNAVVKHPKYWLHLIGMALLMTQNKFVIAARGADGNTAWIVGMILALGAGALVAGVWYLIKRPTKAQTGRHLVVASWAIAALTVLGSYQ